MGASTAKIGRNDPCPCGSGKKFKKCCLDRQLSPEALQEIERQYRADEALRQKHQQTHGLARVPVWTNWRGRKVVAVGSQIVFQPAARPWRTFHEFLIDEARGLFGPVWATAEKAKPIEAQHPVYRMSAGTENHMRKAGKQSDVAGLMTADWNGDAAAFLTLAYDLFTVKDNAELQNRLLRRLRIADQYQGARYELFVIASCVRAGLSIEYADEKDGSRKHPEFIGTHRMTGRKVAVEAKSRHRHGVLGFASKESGTDEHRAGIRRLLMKALEKEPGLPLVVFIDVNLPGSTVADSQTWFREIGEQTLKTVAPADRRKVNMIICTNVPFHYADPNGPLPTSTVSAHQPFDVPLFPMEQQVLEDIVAATRLFMRVPHRFPGDTWESSGRDGP
jgi:hypothetical protein